MLLVFRCHFSLSIIIPGQNLPHKNYKKSGKWHQYNTVFKSFHPGTRGWGKKLDNNKALLRVGVNQSENFGISVALNASWKNVIWWN